MDYLGKEIPKLGFGLMRLPMKDGTIDVEQVKAMTDKFLAAGFTYFDTAFGYPGSEEAIHAALVERYPRERYQLATKLPAWIARDEEAAKKMFFTSLERTGAGYFDFYLLHNLGDEKTDVFERYHMWEFALEQKEKGLIRHLGFSMHDKADALDKVLTRHPEAEFVQLQINYADWESETIQSRKCYETARKHGKPVIIMEPVKGGMLASPPEPVADILKEADPDGSCASWALRFAASLEGVITVLSGMSNLEQMEDNLNTLGRFRPLSEEERDVIGRAAEQLARIPSIPCTGCRYCVKGCPKKINIPSVFEAMNLYLVYKNLESAKRSYGWAVSDGAGKASECLKCGRCEAVCPQHIGIIGELTGAAALLEDK